MKVVYKTNSTTSAQLRETNLMRSLTARLENGYCSISIANHEDNVSGANQSLRENFANFNLDHRINIQGA